MDWLDPGSLGHRQLSLPFSRPRRWRQWMPWTASHELSLRQWPKFVGVDVGALGGMSILLAGRSFSFLSFSYCRRGERFFSHQDTTYFGRATARRRSWLVDCMPSKSGTASSLSPARRLGYLMFHSMTDIHICSSWPLPQLLHSTVSGAVGTWGAWQPITLFVFWTGIHFGWLCGNMRLALLLETPRGSIPELDKQRESSKTVVPIVE